MEFNPRVFNKLSISKIGDGEQCLRYYWLTHACGIQGTRSEKSQIALDFGNRVDKEVENWQKGRGKGPLVGASAAVAEYFPAPGQSGVRCQLWIDTIWADLALVGKADLITPPGTIWGRLSPLRNCSDWVIGDLKTIGDIRKAQTRDQLRENRQLLAYAYGYFRSVLGEPFPSAGVLVSHITVSREAPHVVVQSYTRVWEKDCLIAYEQDRGITRALRGTHDSTLPEQVPGEESRCFRWYGGICPHYEICHPPTGTRSLDAIFAAADADGRGGSGTSECLDRAAVALVLEGQQKKEQETMAGLLANDAANPPLHNLLEGADTYWRTTQMSLKGAEQPYTYCLGARHGKPWCLKVVGSSYRYQIGNGETLQPVPGSSPVRLPDAEGYQSGAAVPGATEDNTGKAPLYRFADPGLVLDPTTGKHDVDRIRRNLLDPLLRAWDVRETPVVAPTPAAPLSPEQGLVALEATSPGNGNSLDTSAIQGTLRNAGLTDLQAAVLAAAGVTLERLKGQSVSEAELAGLKGIGTGRAKAILARFAPAPSSSSPPIQETVNISVAPGMVLPMPVTIPQDIETALYSLYLGCFPDPFGGALYLEEILRPYYKAIAREHSVPDVSCLPEGFRLPGYLAEKLYASPPECRVVIVSDIYGKDWEYSRRFFLDRQISVVRALR